MFTVARNSRYGQRQIIMCYGKLNCINNPTTAEVMLEEMLIQWRLKMAMLRHDVECGAR